jgi:hypothetical protein
MNKYDNMAVTLVVVWLAFAACVTYFGLKAGCVWWQVGLTDWLSLAFIGIGICVIDLMESKAESRRKRSRG